MTKKDYSIRKVEVELKGTTPLLMNNPVSMLDEVANPDKPKPTKGKRDVKKEAEKLAYRDEEGKLYVPAQAIKSCLINAAAYKKIDKYSAKNILAAGVFITPDKIVLNKNTYKIDLRTVVIQRNRVVKARPKIEGWKVQFELSYDERLISSDAPIREILEEAGIRVGILDFRPKCKGNFGMFEVSKWQVQ